MRYLAKNPDSKILINDWIYKSGNTSRNAQIREALIEEQKGYCAYSEQYISPLHACEVEHFDERLKNKPDDNYKNWYAVLRRVNQWKIGKKIHDYLPILLPDDSNTKNRIHYQAGQFQPVNPNDNEAVNLIEFLGMNEPTLAEYRQNVINRLRKDRHDLFESDEDFHEYLRENPQNMSFATALEVEFEITLPV